MEPRSTAKMVHPEGGVVDEKGVVGLTQIQYISDV